MKTSCHYLTFDIKNVFLASAWGTNPMPIQVLQHTAQNLSCTKVRSAMPLVHSWSMSEVTLTILN